MDWNSAAQFKSRCPYCRGTRTPRDMPVPNGERTIKFVCDTCQRVWVRVPAIGSPNAHSGECHSPRAYAATVTPVVNGIDVYAACSTTAQFEVVCAAAMLLA